MTATSQLRLLALLAAIASARAAGVCGAVKSKVDCSAGLTTKMDPKMTEAWCVARGCCYDGATANLNNTCTYAAEGVPVTTVHVIASNVRQLLPHLPPPPPPPPLTDALYTQHFDAGYADLTTNVLNEYFSKYFPLAAKTGAALGQPLHWMTQSYIVSL